MRFLKEIIGVLLLVGIGSCKNLDEPNNFSNLTLNEAEKQMTVLLTQARKVNKLPRTINNEGELHYTPEGFDWTEGFFPGACWYLYEYTNKESWKQAAIDFENIYIDHRLMPNYHDLGFVFNNSFGHGYRLTGDENIKNVLLDASNTLIGRYDSTVGCIKSWDVDKGWQSKRDWLYPVIIDNMLNLEMLFEASIITGDEKYKNVAISHANTTLKNHFRSDNSSYHVIDYDPETGEVRKRNTAQGYSHESSWARGQAWGVYGFTMCYRYTKDVAYLEKALEIVDFYFNHPNLPEDLVPYWDFNAPKLPNEPRDASTAAITASALIELHQYTGNENQLELATQILKNLASDQYTTPIGEDNFFILNHSVGSIPHNFEIDVPIIYADYYYIEALLRLKKENEGKDVYTLLKD